MSKSTILTGSKDLLTYYNLKPIYDKYVKPYPPPNRAEGIDPTLMPYFTNLSGKLDTEYDGYLLNLLRDPQAVETGPEIRPLDAETLRHAFSLKEGPIPGFDASILGSDEADDEYGQGFGGSEKEQYELDHNGERKHKKKKKKRKHGHEHEDDGHGDHKKKKKKKNKSLDSNAVETL